LADGGDARTHLQIVVRLNSLAAFDPNCAVQRPVAGSGAQPLARADPGVSASTCGRRLAAICKHNLMN
jgi:hypothetical protein